MSQITKQSKLMLIVSKNILTIAQVPFPNPYNFHKSIQEVQKLAMTNYFKYHYRFLVLFSHTNSPTHLPLLGTNILFNNRQALQLLCKVIYIEIVHVDIIPSICCFDLCRGGVVLYFKVNRYRHFLVRQINTYGKYEIRKDRFLELYNYTDMKKFVICKLFRIKINCLVHFEKYHK